MYNATTFHLLSQKYASLHKDPQQSSNYDYNCWRVKLDDDNNDDTQRQQLWSQSYLQGVTILTVKNNEPRVTMIIMIKNDGNSSATLWQRSFRPNTDISSIKIIFCSRNDSESNFASFEFTSFYFPACISSKHDVLLLHSLRILAFDRQFFYQRV